MLARPDAIGASILEFGAHAKDARIVKMAGGPSKLGSLHPPGGLSLDEWPREIQHETPPVPGEGIGAVGG